MTTKAFRKDIAALADAKGRKKQKAFVVEGTKCVLDNLGCFKLKHLIATPQWLNSHNFSENIVEANRGEIGEMSSMTLAPDVMAVYELPDDIEFDVNGIENQLVLCLDRIQDPGNFGTIVRLADWMGVTTILASNDTVDCFNPKAIQATMGAIARVKIIYGFLPDILSKLPKEMPVYGTFLNGENIYKATLSHQGIVIMGNEGRGISEEVAKFVNRRLLIPSYPPDRPTSESLNVATATAITLSQFRSRLMK